MSYSEALESISLPVAADYSNNKYHIMYVNATGQAVLVSTKGADALGILQDDPGAVGRTGAVGFKGISKIAAGAAVAAGAEIIADATGRGVATDAADQFVIGTSLSAATAAGDIINVLINKYQN